MSLEVRAACFNINEDYLIFHTPQTMTECDATQIVPYASLSISPTACTFLLSHIRSIGLHAVSSGVASGMLANATAPNDADITNVTASH